jgi:hypothetical protein
MRNVGDYDNMGGMMTKREPPDAATAKRTASLITKMREMHHSIHSSAFYVRTEGDFPDVNPYIARGI